MTQPDCPFCGGATRAHIAAPDRNRRINATIFHLRRCTSCGLFFIADPPADLGLYYPNDYHYFPKAAEDLDAQLGDQRPKIELLTRYVQHGTMLEIGPGIGMFCRLAQLAGFSAAAIEIDPGCVAFLRDVLGVATVESGDPAQAMVHDPSRYDAICLWHSLEHLPRPWDVLREAAAHLSPGGVLLVAAPNPLARQARLMGSHWPHWDLPRHLFGLPIPWLRARAAEAGLVEELMTTRDHDSLFWTRFSWDMMAKRGLGLGRRIRGEMLATIVQRWLAPWEQAEGHGATYTAVFRRPLEQAS